MNEPSKERISGVALMLILCLLLILLFYVLLMFGVVVSPLVVLLVMILRPQYQRRERGPLTAAGISSLSA